ncbi:hypothetical protein FF2_045797 [Malus domestica]
MGGSESSRLEQEVVTCGRDGIHLLGLAIAGFASAVASAVTCMVSVFQEHGGTCLLWVDSGGVTDMSHMTELAPQGHEFYPSFDGFYDDFESIGLRGNLKTTSYAYGFGKPSASQQRGIVPFSQGLDVIQQAPPGTGKTITFSYGIVQQLDLDSAKVYAGVSGRTYREGKFILEAGVHVVGTPDRIFDMLRRKALDPKDIKMIVLDQADDMLTGTFTHKKTRDTVMREFRRCSCRILITTDQYARHLEVQQAGNFGKRGAAINFVARDGEKMLFDIQRSCQQILMISSEHLVFNFLPE